MGEARRPHPGDAQRPFEIGVAVPDFSLSDSDGAPVRLSELVSTQRIVLLFYRGHW